jgi:CRISPR-associated protein Csm1
MNVEKKMKWSEVSEYFSVYQEKLRSAFNASPPKEESGGFLIKGDVSGIQEFIFNIPSKGAARLLKSRSFFVQAMVKLCIHLIQKEVKVSVNPIFDSGGSFLLQVEREVDLAEIHNRINRDLHEFGLYVSLVTAPYNNWGNAMGKMKELEETQKFRKYSTQQDLFEPRNVKRTAQDEEKEIQNWKDFAKILSKSEGYFFTQSTSEELIDGEGFNLFDYRLELTSNPSAKGFVPFGSSQRDGNLLPACIMKEMPIWTEENPYYQAWKNGNGMADGEETKRIVQEEDETELKVGELIGLDQLGKQAKMRTGTDKIGVVKLDVDNLGTLFNEQFKSEASFIMASDAMSGFFGPLLQNVWETGTFANHHKYSDNILVIYAGGDDCFVLGGWDAIGEFTYSLQEAFDEFVDGLPSRITFSAGLLIVGSSYPIIRLGSLAEKALEKAKCRKGKNGVCLFNEVFSWDEFQKARKIAAELKRFIQKGEKKAILQKIRLSAKGYDSLMKGVKLKNQVNFQKVWNLTWFLLRSISKENKEEFTEQIVNKYHEAVLNTLINKDFSSALVYPVAARITELSTRKKEEYVLE